MLEAQISEGALLKRVFDAIKDMVPEVNLECTENGIQLQAMDSSHVALVSLDLRADAFQYLRCTRARTLGLNMAAVAKVFRLCGNEDSVVIRHKDDGDAISFVFETRGEDRVADFDLKLMSIEQDHLGVPESESTATISLPSKTYQKICQDLSQFSDSIGIEASGKSVKFSSRGEIGTGNIVLKPKSGDDDRVEIRCDGNVALSFAARYLNFFAKATPLSAHTIMKLSQGQPLEVMFNLNNDPQLGHLRFYLAPKLDSADDALDEGN